MSKRLTLDQFIEKARKIHGNKYRYDVDSFVNSTTKMRIYCTTHEVWFQQAPFRHFLGTGCRKCLNEKLSAINMGTLDDFIRNAREIHGDKYSYDKVEYKGSHKPIIITCRKCGRDFKTEACSHLTPKKVGCQYCRENNATMSKEDFLKKSHEIHGELYDYSEVEYKDLSTKVKLFCKKHQSYFWQRPSQHLWGSGCIICGREKTATAQCLSKEEFLKRAKEQHGERYDYTNIDFRSLEDNITIVCNNCKKSFEVLPRYHLTKNIGCRKCYGIKKIVDKEAFVEAATNLYGNKYDYTNSIFARGKPRISVYCNNCKKDYVTTRSEFLKGHECHCQRTSLSRGENIIRKILVENNIEFEQEKRFSNCRHKKPLPFDFYAPVLKVCIEYQGAQHFREVKYFSKGDKNKLKEQLKRDSIKKKYCEDNNIRLVVITHEEDIKTRLIEENIIKGE